MNYTNYGSCADLIWVVVKSNRFQNFNDGIYNYHKEDYLFSDGIVILKILYNIVFKKDENCVFGHIMWIVIVN